MNNEKNKDDRKVLTLRYRMDINNHVSFVDPCCDEIPAQLFGQLMIAISDVQYKWNRDIDNIKNEPKYESQPIMSIANNRVYIEKDILAIDDPDGFVSLSLSRHLGSDIPIPNEIGDKYLYNKKGEVISVRTGSKMKLHHNEFKASHEGVVYEVYMPKNSILASRVEPSGEMDDIIFRTIKDACEHFKCNYRTIKSCLDRSGEKEFKGYYFEYGWPEPYVLGVKKRRG